MRTGTNPAKAGIPAYTPNKLGIALIVYIPFTDGYFSNSLQILKYQIDSLKASTPQGFDLLVFDNGSCPQVVNELKTWHAQGVVDWLVLSRHNMGKAGAWNWIFAAMPNELICYADSDVLFRPGWLEASLEVLEAFPQAGMIAAQPNFFDVMEGKGRAHLTLKDNEGYEFGSYWPAKEIIAEYCAGIGATEELAAQFYAQPLPAVTNKEQDVQAVLGASHMQFLTTRQAARQIVPLPATKGLLRTETMSIDFKMDELGFLHLSTQKPYVFHMGNTINERLLSEIEQITGKTPAKPARADHLRPTSRWQRWLAILAKRPRSRQFMLRVYNQLFRALYNEGS